VVILLAIFGGLLLCLAIIVRELSVSRERTESQTTNAELRHAVDVLRGHLQRTSDDLYVLRSTLEERHVVSDNELAKNRARLIDNPRRVAAERREVTRTADADPTQVVIDEGESVH
jgi:hypothetical protein